MFSRHPKFTHPTEGEYLPCRLDPGREGTFSLRRRAGEDWCESDSGLTMTALGLAGEGSCRGSLPGTMPVQLKRHTLYAKGNIQCKWPASRSGHPVKLIVTAYLQIRDDVCVCVCVCVYSHESV